VGGAENLPAITLMTFAIFTRSNMVVTTGWPQLVDTLLVVIGTCAIAFAMFGRFSAQTVGDFALRLALAALAASCCSIERPMGAVSLPALRVATIVGILRHQHVSPPAVLVSEATVKSPDLSALIAEAKREL